MADLRGAECSPAKMCVAPGACNGTAAVRKEGACPRLHPASGRLLGPPAPKAWTSGQLQTRVDTDRKLFDNWS